MRTSFGEGALGLYAEGTVADSWETEVCDILRPNNHVEMQQVMDAMRSYAKQPNRNLAELMMRAKQLRVEKRMRSYMEVLI